MLMGIVMGPRATRDMETTKRSNMLLQVARETEGRGRERVMGKELQLAGYG